MIRKILILTDTHSCQTNGVTRCLDYLTLPFDANTNIEVVSSDNFVSVPFIGYKEIRLSLAFPQKIFKKIEEIRPDAVHIMTEGPIGFTAAFVCKKYKIPYTTTFHTKFPEYLYLRNRLIRPSIVHRYLRFIHDVSAKIFISHKGVQKYLENEGYKSFEIVPLGIDHEIFKLPAGQKSTHSKPRLLFVGRIAVEKNIEDFLKISDDYEKIVVGDGPLREELEAMYPTAKFLGVKKGEELARIYQESDVFVFPSKTDTLGLVNLEALACGTPVVAYDLETMRGVVKNGVSGVLVSEEENLESGIETALKLNTQDICEDIKKYNWKNYQKTFIQSQIPINYTHVDFGNF
ncbi:alpha-mannosyltransferase [Candidatus Gracilibacteria bacterium]|nr:MAG: alpha-mannosyltransferase [Candidatus Gracilibacteria bacterium]